MATGNVTTYHESGGLTASEYRKECLHAKIGAANWGESGKTYMISNPAMAKEIFKSGELLDSLIQHFEEFDVDNGEKPVPVLAVRVPASNDGNWVTIQKQAKGTGRFTTISPQGLYSLGETKEPFTVVVEITGTGDLGAAKYKYSYDKGKTWSLELVLPASGNIDFRGFGIKPNTGNYIIGDRFKIEIKTSYPRAFQYLSTIYGLTQEYRAYFIHIVGAKNSSFAAMVNTIATKRMANENNLPTFFVLEGNTEIDPTSNLNYSQHIINEIDSYNSFFSDRVAVVQAAGLYISGGIANAGGIEEAQKRKGEWRNAASFLCARLSASAVNESAAWVKKNRSRTFIAIRYWEDGYQQYMDTLDDQRFTIMKKYNDWPGIYIAKDNIKSHPDSDFAGIPERRRADKMHRIVRRTCMPHLQADAEVESTSGGIAAVEAEVNASVAGAMMKPGEKEISTARVIIDPKKTYWKNQVLEASLAMGIKGRTKDIKWTTSFKRERV